MTKDFRYLAVLCIGALGVLIAGVLLKPERAAAPVPSESDLLRLQLAAQRRDFERRSLFLRSKARELEPFAADARSGARTADTRPARTGDTVILVAPGDAWASAVIAGSFRATCGNVPLQEIGSTITIPANLENAVAFDLDDNVAGFVIACGDRRLLTNREGLQAWTAERDLEQKLIECCGLRVQAAGSELEVIEIGMDSPLRKAGLREGDRIVSPASREEVPGATDLVIRRGNGTRKLKVQVSR